MPVKHIDMRNPANLRRSPPPVKLMAAARRVAEEADRDKTRDPEGGGPNQPYPSSR